MHNVPTWLSWCVRARLACQFALLDLHKSVLRTEHLLPRSFHQAAEPAQPAALVDRGQAAWNKPTL